MGRGAKRSVPRQGIVGQDGEDEIVSGIVLMRKGENPSEVLKAVKARVDALNASILPKPVRVVAFNTTEGWARDVSQDIAGEILKRVASEGQTLADSTRRFCALQVGEKETERAEGAAL